MKKNLSSETEVPVLGKIAAGTPVEAIQNEVSRIPLPANLEKNGDYFGLKVQGDSMIEAGINAVSYTHLTLPTMLPV